MNHYIRDVNVEPETPMGVLDERTIGRILVDHGKLKREDIDRVFRLHKEKGMRFGDAACKLKLVTKADIQQALAVQFNYPCLQPGEAILGAELVAAYQPSSQKGEAIRDLRSQLLFRWFDSRQKTLAIVSPSSGDGRSYLTANLAVAFSQWGGTTLLIDADLRSPRQHQIFSVPGQVGLSSILSGRAWLEAIRPIPYFGNLSILPAGAMPPNPVELLGRQEFVRMLSDISRNYEFVLIDTPASEKGSDAVNIAARAGGAVMVARQDHSRLPQLHDLMDGMTGYGAQVVGTVLNQH